MILKYQKYQEFDYELFKSLVQDDELMFYITGHALSETQTRKKFDEILSINLKDKHLGYFKVLNQEDEFLGDCKLEFNIKDNTQLELGYILKKQHWRKGIGTHICQYLLSQASTYYPDLDLIAIIDPENIASKTLLEKFNFKSYFIGIEDDLPTEKLILKSKIY